MTSQQILFKSTLVVLRVNFSAEVKHHLGGSRKTGIWKDK